MATTALSAPIAVPTEAYPPSWGFRQAVVCLFLIAVCFDQAPGRTVPDTKLDLVVAPWRLLGRALSMWDPQSAAGVVQNQAGGYLWPTGPFFGVLHSLGLPAWVVQRGWWSLVVVVAFLGIVRLGRALGAGTEATRLLAGVAFALSPRMFASLGPISVEVLPLALSPWVLLPLVDACRGRSVRRSAALSALAVLCMGGVNAAATLGGVLPAALFLLLGPVAVSRLRLAAWWVLAVALATAWWVLPLLLLGRYAAPFLPYTETAGVTTSVTSLTEVLRGTSNWVTYLYDTEGPLRPAGWDLLTSRPLVLASGLVVALGLAGVAMRRAPARAWLVGSLLLGVLLVSAGHAGVFGSPVSAWVRVALDGRLAPLRNVHKFDPLVRLPLVLGAAHALGAVRWRRDPTLTPVLRQLATAAAWVAVLVALVPAVAGHIPAGRSFARVPVAWSDVAHLLARDGESGRALLLPSSPFAEYTWGDPVDEPFQPLADSPWEVRDVSPLVPAGHVRLLDAVDQQLRAGRPSAGLADLLARSGVSHLVVRNDLRPSTGAVPADVVRSVLRDSPGFTLMPSLETQTPGVGSGRPSLEVYRIVRSVSPVTATPLSGVTLLRGGPESLLPALEDGLLDGSPAVLAAQLPPSIRFGRTLLTDGLQRREQEFASARHLTSPVLGPKDPLVFDRPAREHTIGTSADETVAELLGAKAVLASSSLSDPDVGFAWSPSHLAYAAVDGDPSTTWTAGSRPLGPVGQWLELDVGRRVDASTVRVVWGSGAVVRRVRLDTDAGTVRRVVAGTGTEELALPVGSTERVRLTVEAVDRSAGDGQVSVAELEVPGVHVVRSLVVSPLPGGVTPDAVQLAASRVHQDACVSGGRCDPARAFRGDDEGGLVRRFDVGAGGGYDAGVTVVPRAGRALDALLDQQPPAVRVLATSRSVDEPLGGPAAALDGDLGTGWTAAVGDATPGLVLGWLGPLRLSSLRIVVDPVLGAASATRVRVRAAGRSYEEPVASDGTVRFPAVTTQLLALDLLAARQPTPAAQVGVGISELVIPGLQGLAVQPASTPVALACGSTPAVAINGRLVTTAGSTTVADLRALRPVRLTPCGGGSAPLRLTGQVRLLTVSTPALRVDRVDLRRRGLGTAQAEPVTVRRLSWGNEHRRVQVEARSGPVLLTVRENINRGWSARANGLELVSVPVDGWQQGWVVPAGKAVVVDLHYWPGLAYRWALLIGAVAVGLLVLLAVLPARSGGRQRLRRRRTGASTAAAVAVAAALGLLAGVPGLMAWAVAVGVHLAGRRRRAAVVPAWVAGAAYALAAAGLALRPWGGADYAGSSRPVTALSLLALAAATVTLPERAASAASPDVPGSDD